MDKTSWLTATYDEMVASVDAFLTAAGYDRRHVIWSLYETVNDGVKEDMSDWVVCYPDWTTCFARGAVEFVSWTFEDEPIVSESYNDPTWGDLLIEAEDSCRMRGAPELDHLFLESCDEIEGDNDGTRRFEMSFGS